MTYNVFGGTLSLAQSINPAFVIITMSISDVKACFKTNRQTPN